VRGSLLEAIQKNCLLFFFPWIAHFLAQYVFNDAQTYFGAAHYTLWVMSCTYLLLECLIQISMLSLCSMFQYYQMWYLLFLFGIELDYLVWSKNTTMFFHFLIIEFDDSRVDQPVTKYLSAQGRLDSRRGLLCFWCPNKTWTPSPGTYNTLTIIINRLEMRKLQPRKIKGIKNSKKQTTKRYKGQFPNT